MKKRTSFYIQSIVFLTVAFVSAHSARAESQVGFQVFYKDIFGCNVPLQYEGGEATYVANSGRRPPTRYVETRRINAEKLREEECFAPNEEESEKLKKELAAAGFDAVCSARVQEWVASQNKKPPEWEQESHEPRLDLVVSREWFGLGKIKHVTLRWLSLEKHPKSPTHRFEPYKRHDRCSPNAYEVEITRFCKGKNLENLLTKSFNSDKEIMDKSCGSPEKKIKVQPVDYCPECEGKGNRIPGGLEERDILRGH